RRHVAKSGHQRRPGDRGCGRRPAQRRVAGHHGPVRQPDRARLAGADVRLRVLGPDVGDRAMNHVHLTPAEHVDTHSATRRTLLALLAGVLGAIPLKALLSDNSWLVEGWLTMAIVVAPAALLRLRRAPSALDIWPGVILLVPWLTVVYVRQ